MTKKTKHLRQFLPVLFLVIRLHDPQPYHLYLWFRPKKTRVVRSPRNFCGRSTRLDIVLHRTFSSIRPKIRPRRTSIAFQIDELHRHNQNLVGTFAFLLCNVPTVVYRHKNCCKYGGLLAISVLLARDCWVISDRLFWQIPRYWPKVMRD